jgi:hypothetical protein
MSFHAYVTYVADRAATREIEALADFYGLGQLIVKGDLSYDAARDQLVDAFTARDMSGATAKTYVSQGYALAQLFDTFADVETFADDECKGSRSLKRIYDATRVRADKGEAEAEGKGEAEAALETGEPTPLVDVILANLASLTNAADIARVRDAAIAMLTVAAAA